MIQFHVVDAGNKVFYADVMEAHHRLRKTLYIDGRGWRALRAVDGRESDQFDLPSTIYIFGLTPSGALVSGSRLHPSLGPTLMADVFPQLAALRGLERSPDVYEWTRVFIDPAKRAEGRSAREAGAIYCAVMQFALDRCIRSLNIVTETFYLSRYVALGWRVKVLGEVLPHDGMSLVGINLAVDEATIAATRAVYNLDPIVFAARGNPQGHRTDHAALLPA